ncbi:MAG TPA: amidohydrolase family protein [Myxococcota bacterium]|nr:amidohydrolase family protein [Myxococcota bacterium]
MGSPWKLFLATDLIDTHSHLFSASWVDWMETLLRESFRHDVVDTATEERIGWLLGFQDLGISRMAISGMYDPAVYQKEGWINQSLNRPTVDDVTAHAWIRSPDYFIPFVRDFELDPSNVDAPAYVQSWLEAGFRGVGELFVHGHGFDYVGDLDFLAKICRVAARYDAPVLVHWEIGQVDDRKFVTSADENFEQLQELLHMVRTGPGSGENPPLKLILAHCGAGPGAKLMLERNGLLESYERKLDILLDNPNVYFDIAGTVGVGGSDFWAIDYERPERSQPTEVGKSILSRIQAKPDQFMVGFDAETRFFSGHQIGLHSVEEYRASVNHYLDYLRYEGTLGIFALNKVQSENARKLWPRMTRP